MTRQGLSCETLAAQASGESDPATGALVPPIHPSTIYEAIPMAPSAGASPTHAPTIPRTTTPSGCSQRSKAGRLACSSRDNWRK